MAAWLNPAVADALPASIPMTEYAHSSSMLGPINASYAYSHGITGKGVTIVMMDSGIDAAHSEFSAVGKLLQGYNALSGTTDVTDAAGHGTHTAGIAAAGYNGSGIVGVAYDARLLPIKVLDYNGVGSTAYLDRGLQYAIGKAQIANISLNSAGRYDPGVVQSAVNAGLLLVVAAGNSGAANPGWPARFAKEAWANNQIIAVGAVDANNHIASFSNRAGDAAAWFLVAPGVDIRSTYLNNQYAYLSGTSMAAPVVSGAAALIKQMWPTLRADQIANILFLTATDLGAPGVDAVYGRGLLNIEKALQPIGNLLTPAANGTSISITGSMAQPSPATSALWRLAAAGNLRVVGLDNFQRNFTVDLGATVAKPLPLSLNQVLGANDNRMEVADRVLPDGSHMLMAYDRTQVQFGQPGSFRLAAFSLISKQARGREMAFGFGGLAENYFGIGGMKLASNNMLGTVQSLSNPYFSLVPGASHVAVAQKLGGIKIKFGVLTSADSQAPMSPQNLYMPMSAPSFSSLPKANAALIEISRSSDNTAIALSISRTNESNAYLGARSSGALLLGEGAATSSMQLSGALLLTPTLALAGQASYGMTPGTTNKNSLIAEVSEARTNAFSLALIASDNFKPGDRLSFSVAQPLRTYSGQLVTDMLSGIDSNGAQTRERILMSMAPVAREVRTELNYHVPLARDATLRYSFLLRRNPNNFDNVPMEKLLAMRYSKQF